jgi:hypothetical protein
MLAPHLLQDLVATYDASIHFVYFRTLRPNSLGLPIFWRVMIWVCSSKRLKTFSVAGSSAHHRGHDGTPG